MHHHDHGAKPVGGVLLDRPMILLLALFGIAEGFIAYRFVAGIGAISNMNDGYAWGIWEPINVVVFTGIGAGAYSVGLLCYLLNRGHYHPLVRPAVLLAAIAYSLGGSSILIALGRPWNMYWLALPGLWNLSSVLLEVAICVMAYVSVLWIEMLPAVMEGAAASASEIKSAWGRRWGHRLALVMPYVIALAMLLPTMHQSSLGGLMVVAGPKLHPLWYSTLLPLLALVSCLSMGLGAVVVLTGLMRHAWEARSDHTILVEMSKVNGGLLILFAVIRLGDIAVSGKLARLGDLDFYTGFFALEMALFLVPAIVFFTRKVEHAGVRFTCALLSVLAGALWRIDTFIVCYNAGESWHYWPSWGEISVTGGMAALGVAVFIAVSKLFPVVPVQQAAQPPAAADPGPRAYASAAGAASPGRAAFDTSAERPRRALTRRS